MTNRAILGLMFLAAILATPASAQSISATDWERFLEESDSGLSGLPDDPRSWEDALYEAGQGRGQAAALARFAEEIGATPEQAGRYAGALVTSVVVQDCESGVGCVPVEPGSPAFEAIMGPALEEPTGELLWRVGANLGTGSGRMGPGVFVNAIWDHPARTRVISRLHDYSEADVFLIALVLASPLDPAALKALEKVNVEPDGDPDAWDGWRLAALEAAAVQARADGATVQEQALYAQVLLAQYFNLGLTDQGLALWRATSPEVQALLPLPAPKCTWEGDEGRRACFLRGSGEALADELTAALWLEGDQAATRAWLAQAEARLGATAGWRRRAEHMALVDALDRTRPVQDLFLLLVRGDTPPDERDHGSSGDDAWAFVGHGPAARRVVIDRVQGAGYGSVAAAMARRSTYFRDRDYGGELSRMTDMLAPVTARRTELAAAIDAAWDPGLERRFSPANARPVRPAGWVETRLPDGVSPWAPAPSGDEDDDEDMSSGSVERPAGATEPPVSPYAVLRHEVIDGEQVVLFMSAEYDLPGELPAPGVWMVRTEGGVWTKPVYLGLQQHFPYVITPQSSVPLILLADGRLRIEVQVREIDPASITFPPVGLRLAREENGVVIERDLADLLRDADGDGMTDVAERRVGLDPANADTDGDGRPDGADSIPLTPWSADIPPARTALARVIIQRLTGHGDAAIVIPADLPEDLDAAMPELMGSEPPPPRPNTILMVGDPGLFAALDLPFQLLVYTPEQIARLSDGAPPSFPPEVTIYSSLDGLEHLVVWSASWIGGRFIARCPADGSACEVEALSEWIT